MKKTGLQGFTLLEMAIVVTIIAFIIGGVLAARAIITNAQLQTVMTDVNSITVATNNFKQLYQSLPGDFSGATTAWGGTTVQGFSITNGNNDGEITPINYYIGHNYGSDTQENNQFWLHLQLAGMYSKPLSTPGYIGVLYAWTPCLSQYGAGLWLRNFVCYGSIGGTFPAGSIPGSGFSVIWYGTVPAPGAYTTTDYATAAPRFFGNYGNVIVFGATGAAISTQTMEACSYYGVTVDCNITRDPVLAPDQAQAIDTKMDDGSPMTGKVRAFAPTAYSQTAMGGTANQITPNCVLGPVYGIYIYNTVNNTSNQPYCSLIFVMGF